MRTVAAAPATDWELLARPHTTRHQLKSRSHPHDITLENGLLRRTFRIAPNFATVGYENLSTGIELIRSVKPEAPTAIVISWMAIASEDRRAKGVSRSMPTSNREWPESMTTDPARLQFAATQRVYPQSASPGSAFDTTTRTWPGPLTEFHSR